MRDIDTKTLRRNLKAFAQALKVLEIPVILTAVTPEMWGGTLTELTETLPDVSVIARTQVNACLGRAASA